VLPPVPVLVPDPPLVVPVPLVPGALPPAMTPVPAVPLPPLLTVSLPLSPPPRGGVPELCALHARNVAPMAPKMNAPADKLPVFMFAEPFECVGARRDAWISDTQRTHRLYNRISRTQLKSGTSPSRFEKSATGKIDNKLEARSAPTKLQFWNQSQIANS
jgi:hypothetical protein